MIELHGGNVYRAAAMTGRDAADIIDFSANINPLGFPPGLRGAVAASLDGVTRYPDPDYRELRQALSVHCALEPDLIVPGNGAMELIGLLFRVLLPRRALVVAPTFTEYERSLAAAGAVIDYSPLREENGFTPDPHEIADCVPEHDIAVICNPNNPTGGFLTPAEIETLCAAAAVARCRLVVDESFVDFAGADGVSAVGLAAAYPGLIIVRSLTKFYGIPGLRLGFLAAGDRELIRRLAQARDPWSVNHLAMSAAPVMLADREFGERTRALISAEREFLAGGLGALGWVRPYSSRANFILARILNGRTAASLRDDCLSRRLLIRDASNFTFLDNSWFRVAVKDRAANAMLIAALREIGLR